MIKPLICEYLLTHTLQQLEDDHGVCARPNKTLDKIGLNYDQFLVKNGDKLAEQCRGLILRPLADLTEGNLKSRVVGETHVLAWPMNRFYNHGDFNEAPISWSDHGLRVLEKLDGTMIVMYWDPKYNKFCTATRSVPEADLPIKQGHLEIGDATFSDLFWRAYHETTNSVSIAGR